MVFNYYNLFANIPKDQMKSLIYSQPILSEINLDIIENVPEDIWFSDKTMSTVILCFGVQAVIGILALEYAWRKTERMR